MKVGQVVLHQPDPVAVGLQSLQSIAPQLLLVFASTDMLHAVAAPLAAAFPAAIRVGCSTAGEISSEGVSDQSCVVTALHLAKSSVVESSTRLADMAAQAASQEARKRQASARATGAQSLALLVSCVGRKLVMGGRVEEEIEAVTDVLGPSALPTGFYSNGEISPLAGTRACKLHNQTMTITRIAEL